MTIQTWLDLGLKKSPSTNSISDSLNIKGKFIFPKHKVWFYFRTQETVCISSLCYYHSSNCLSPLRQGEAQQCNEFLFSHEYAARLLHFYPFPLWKDPSMAVLWFLEISQYPVSSYTQQHFTTVYNLQQRILSNDFRKYKYSSEYHLSNATFLWYLKRTSEN